jgi:hypothetical protein
MVYVTMAAPMSKAETIEDGRIWLTYALERRLSPQWKVTLQIQPYWRDEGHAYDQVTYRSGLYYQLNDRAFVGGGYAYASGHPDHRSNTHENRVWEDIGYQWGDGRAWQLSTRTRLEHRQFEHQGAMLHSVRQLLKFSVPMGPKYTFVVSDEYYANLNRTAQGDTGFDQNRFLLGVATRLAPETLVELDYINQYAPRADADIDNHILALTLSQRF